VQKHKEALLPATKPLPSVLALTNAAVALSLREKAADALKGKDSQGTLFVFFTSLFK